jgi:uncharacterized membrane protein YfcA
MTTLILISVIYLAAGFTQGFSGFGSALLAMPLLTLFLDAKTAVPLSVLNSVLITSYLSLKLKSHMERGKIMPLVWGSLPGTYIGVKFLIYAESDIIKLLLGLLIVSYCLYFLIARSVPRMIHHLWAYPAGFFTGFIGSAFNTGGPPAIIYSSLTGWTKDQIKATLTGFFFISSIFTAAVHITSGLVSEEVLKYFTASALSVLIGVYAGSHVYSRTNGEAYLKIMLIILCILGIVLMISAL